MYEITRMIEVPIETRWINSGWCARIAVRKKTAGTSAALKARINCPACDSAARALNLTVSRFQPPATIDSPPTKRRFPTIDPLNEARTTSGRPARIAKMAMMSSARFPNVALNSAPYVDPMRCASCSVLNPIHAASGSTATHAKMNNHTGLRCVIRTKMAIGIVAYRTQLAARFTRAVYTPPHDQPLDRERHRDHHAQPARKTERPQRDHARGFLACPPAGRPHPPPPRRRHHRGRSRVLRRR